MKKNKEQPKKESKTSKTAKPLTYENVEVEGEIQTKITYPDGRVEYREL